MSVLLIAEVNGGAVVLDATAKALTAAKALGPVTVLAAGAGVDATGVAALDGVSKVLVADDAAYAHQLAEPLADLIVALAPGFDHIVAPATSAAKSVLPRVAALLDVMVIPEVIAIVDANTFARPTYAGNAVQTVRSSDPVKVLTVRTASFPRTAEGPAAPVEAVSVAAVTGQTTWVEDRIASTDRPDLNSAKVVVAGGRGLGSEENFAMIDALADKLHGAVGASRAAVDAGFAPNDAQVGQTGKVVAPDLYIAVGVSGAIQHVAGMKDSKVIVAINKDEEAPIFQVADFGLVADLFTAVPELTSKL